MIHLPQDGILYHGSYMEVSRIDISQCRAGLDFGKGFYVTSSLQQAVSYIPASVRKAKRRGLLAEIFSESDGRVSVYQFQSNPRLVIHCFDDEHVHDVDSGGLCHGHSLKLLLRKTVFALS